MVKFKTGDEILVKCRAEPGPFPDELVVEFNSVEGLVSGFVQRKELHEIGGEWFIHAFVNEVHGDTLEVRVQGSFFSTNGLANITHDITMKMAA